MTAEQGDISISVKNLIQGALVVFLTAGLGWMGNKVISNATDIAVMQSQIMTIHSDIEELKRRVH